MPFTYPKSEKLKSTKTIGSLFTEGKSVSKYPLRLVYIKETHSENGLKFGVSVSKKYFKKAVDRNYYKLVLRECYRLNQDLLKQNIKATYSMMFFYQTKERLTYQEIFEKTQLLFAKFIESELKIEEKKESI